MTLAQNWPEQNKSLPVLLKAIYMPSNKKYKKHFTVSFWSLLCRIIITVSLWALLGVNRALESEQTATMLLVMGSFPSSDSWLRCRFGLGLDSAERFRFVLPLAACLGSPSSSESLLTSLSRLAIGSSRDGSSISSRTASSLVSKLSFENSFLKRWWAIHGREFNSLAQIPFMVFVWSRSRWCFRWPPQPRGWECDFRGSRNRAPLLLLPWRAQLGVVFLFFSILVTRILTWWIKGIRRWLNEEVETLEPVKKS